MPFVDFDPAKYDFSKAPRYRKTATLDASQIEVAQAEQEIVTVIDGKEETRKTAKPGDFIITGVKGERYVIGKDKFPKLYEQDPKNPDTYVSKGVRKALPLIEDTKIQASWGPMDVAKGGVVVLEDDGKGVYGIEKGAFEKSYGRADQNGEVFVALNAPLTTQLRAAGERGLDDHKADIMRRIQEASRGSGMGERSA